MVATPPQLSSSTSFSTGGYLMSWSFCHRSNQSAPNCIYTAPLTRSSQQNQWSHSSRGSGEPGARWEPATLCRRPMWITTGAILGCTPLSWATSWRNVSWHTVARMQGHHDNHVVAAEHKTVGCFILLVHDLELNVPGIYAGRLYQEILTCFCSSLLRGWL
jgi:hypothetical protein